MLFSKRVICNGLLTSVLLGVSAASYASSFEPSDVTPQGFSVDAMQFDMSRIKPLAVEIADNCNKSVGATVASAMACVAGRMGELAASFESSDLEVASSHGRAQGIPKYGVSANEILYNQIFSLHRIARDFGFPATLRASSDLDCSQYSSNGKTIANSCLIGTVMVLEPDTGIADGLAAFTCTAIHDEPVVLTSVVCTPSNGIFVAMAGQNAAAIGGIVARPNSLKLDATGIQPGGVTNGSTQVSASLFVSNPPPSRLGLNE